MKRTQIQLDESIHKLARQRAFDEGISMAAVVREVLAQYLTTDRAPALTIEDLGFVGVGSSNQADLSPVSERHDEALEQALGH